MKQSIVLINQDSGYLMIDIANAFAEHFQSCHLIAGRLVQRDVPLKDNVVFRKIIRYDRRSLGKRALTWIVGFSQILALILTKFRKHRLFIVSNPPLAPLLPLFCRNRFCLLIFDVYPDALHGLGFLNEKSLVVKLWEKANKIVYARADKIFTITEGMKTLLQNYYSEGEITVVPVWTNNNFLKPIPKHLNPFASKHDLLDKFVVLYSGNLGLSHDVEVIVEIAARIDHPDIYFLIIGDGEKKRSLQEKIEKYRLKNCKLLPFQSVDILPYSLSSADAAIVTIGIKASNLSIPSKAYNLMSVGTPLVCIADKSSELAKLIDKHDIGKCFEPKQFDEIRRFIIDLALNPKQQKIYRKNALKASLSYRTENSQKFL